MIFDIEWRKSRNLLLILSFALRDKPFFKFRSILSAASDGTQRTYFALSLSAAISTALARLSS